MRQLRAVLAIVALSGAGPTLAEPSSLENRLRDQLRATTNELQTVKGNQAALEARVAAAEAERDAARAKASKPAVAPADTARLRAAAEKANAEAQARGSELTAANGKIATLTADLAKARVETERVQQAAAANAAALGRVNTAIGDCIEKNARLMKVADEILDAYRRIGVGTVLVSREPFIGKKRVALETASQDFDNRLHDEKCAPVPVAQTVGAP